MEWNTSTFKGMKGSYRSFVIVHHILESLTELLMTQFVELISIITGKYFIRNLE